MTETQSSAQAARRAPYAPGSGEGRIQWIRPEGSGYVPPAAAARAPGRERSDRTTAMIVITLTMACTLLAIFDLFQLATGI